MRKTEQELIYGWFRELQYMPVVKGSTLEIHVDTDRQMAELESHLLNFFQECRTKRIGRYLCMHITPTGASVMQTNYNTTVELHFKEKDQDNE